MEDRPASSLNMDGRDIGEAAARPAISDEAIRVAARLRASLPGAHQVILFTGVTEREGVSGVAGQVACALAQVEQSPVLLLDANFRSPAQHTGFKIPQGPGLSDLIRKNVQLRDAIHPTAMPGLSLLPTGAAVVDAVSLFASPEWVRLVNTLREQFKFVVIDSAPVLRFADSTLIVPRTDGVVIVMTAGKRRRAELVEAKRLLEGLKANLVGVVLAERTVPASPHSNGRQG